jgi:sugar lactone lactonase YvrE
LPRRSARLLGWSTLGVLALAGLGTLLAPALPAGEVPLGTPVQRFAAPSDYPEGLAWDGTSLWVNNFTNGTLYEVDPQDGHVRGAYSGHGLPTRPEGLAWDGTDLWTSDWVTGQILRFHPTGNSVDLVAAYDKPADAGKPVGLEWDGTHLWIACFGFDIGDKGNLFEIDTASFTVVKKLVLPVWWVEDLAWDGHRLWSVDWLFRVGFSIDPATGDTANSYTTPGPNPVGMAWDGTRLWVGDTSADSIWALDVSAAHTTPVRGVSWSELKAKYRN